MRVETTDGILLYWPPHDGILYCVAGPVSRNVRVVIVGTAEEIAEAVAAAHTPDFGFHRGRYFPAKIKLAPDYEVETRTGEVREHSVRIPEQSELIVRMR